MTDPMTGGAGTTLPEKNEIVKRYEALYNYTQQNPDDLELVKGDYYDVWDLYLDDWYLGHHVRSGLVGHFPASYVKPVYDQESNQRNQLKCPVCNDTSTRCSSFRSSLKPGNPPRACVEPDYDGAYGLDPIPLPVGVKQGSLNESYSGENELPPPPDDLLYQYSQPPPPHLAPLPPTENIPPPLPPKENQQPHQFAQLPSENFAGFASSSYDASSDGYIPMYRPTDGHLRLLESSSEQDHIMPHSSQNMENLRTKMRNLSPIDKSALTKLSNTIANAINMTQRISNTMNIVERSNTNSKNTSAKTQQDDNSLMSGTFDTYVRMLETYANWLKLFTDMNDNADSTYVSDYGSRDSSPNTVIQKTSGNDYGRRDYATYPNDTSANDYGRRNISPNVVKSKSSSPCSSKNKYTRKREMVNVNQSLNTIREETPNEVIRSNKYTKRYVRATSAKPRSQNDHLEPTIIVNGDRSETAPVAHPGHAQSLEPQALPEHSVPLPTRVSAGRRTSKSSIEENYKKEVRTSLWKRLTERKKKPSSLVRWE